MPPKIHPLFIYKWFNVPAFILIILAFISLYNGGGEMFIFLILLAVFINFIDKNKEVLKSIIQDIKSIPKKTNRHQH